MTPTRHNSPFGIMGQLVQQRRVIALRVTEALEGWHLLGQYPRAIKPFCPSAHALSDADSRRNMLSIAQSYEDMADRAEKRLARAGPPPS
jgi:hypothetical protein